MVNKAKICTMTNMMQRRYQAISRSREALDRPWTLIQNTYTDKNKNNQCAEEHFLYESKENNGGN